MENNKIPYVGGDVHISYNVKDSGKREQFKSGMVRDVTTGKTDYTLVMDGPMFERWAVHLTKGAQKYEKRNWMKASDIEELNRFKESALRHFIQWFNDIDDEDHAAAVFFNINGAEYTKKVIYEAYNLSYPSDVREGQRVCEENGGDVSKCNDKCDSGSVCGRRRNS